MQVLDWGDPNAPARQTMQIGRNLKGRPERQRFFCWESHWSQWWVSIGNIRTSMYIQTILQSLCINMPYYKPVNIPQHLSHCINLYKRIVLRSSTTTITTYKTTITAIVQWFVFWFYMSLPKKVRLIGVWVKVKIQILIELLTGKGQILVDSHSTSRHSRVLFLRWRLKSEVFFYVSRSAKCIFSNHGLPKNHRGTMMFPAILSSVSSGHFPLPGLISMSGCWQLQLSMFVTQVCNIFHMINSIYIYIHIII